MGESAKEGELAGEPEVSGRAEDLHKSFEVFVRAELRNEWINSRGVESGDNRAHSSRRELKLEQLRVIQIK